MTTRNLKLLSSRVLHVSGAHSHCAAVLDRVSTVWLFSRAVSSSRGRESVTVTVSLVEGRAWHRASSCWIVLVGFVPECPVLRRRRSDPSNVAKMTQKFENSELFGKHE